MAMHLLKVSILVVTFDLVVLLRYTAGSSNWLGSASLKNWYVTRGSAIDFDCRITDSSASVNLVRESTVLTVDGVKVAQVGQRFTVYKFSAQDKGKYKCQERKADGTKTFLVLGTFNNVNARSPTVNASPKTITVLENGSATFRCQSSSSKIKSITWFKDMKPLTARWQNSSTNGNVHTNTLKLSNLLVKESGRYECRTQLTYRFSVMIGYWPADAKLIVTDFKFLTTKRRSFFVGDVGSSVNINCETSDPNASVSLWKEELNGYLKTVVPDGTKIIKKGGRYGIHNISLKDGRKYVCKATSTYGQAISLDMGTLVVLQGGHRNPKAYMTPTSKTLELGESFNFTCHAFGDAIAFTWFKNGRPVPVSMLVAVPTRLYKGYSRFESLLVIKKAQKSMEGIYKCRITSGRQPGYINNATANLTIYECPKPNGKFADPVDRAVYMECKNGVAIRRRCPASMQYWDDMVKQCVFPATTPTTPFLRWLSIKDKYQQAAYGSNLMIDCRLTDPSVKVKLSKINNGVKVKIPVNGVKVKLTGQMFTITDLDSQDSADYVCQADGMADQPRARLYVNADLSLSLAVSMSPSHGLLELETTHTYTIRCKSLYIGKMYWYKVDPSTQALTLITKGTNETQTRIKGHYITEWELKLSKVTLNDAGIYMCRKNNSIKAVTNATIEVVVKAPTKPAIVTDTTKEVTQSESTTFTSKITGSPLPIVTLSKGGVTLVTCVGGQAPHCIKKTDRYSGSWKKDKSLVIAVSKVSYPADDGEFLFTARNVAGEKQFKVKVTINVPPAIFKKNSPFQFALSNAKQQITCRVTASRPNPNFTWEHQQWPCDSSKYATCKPIKNNWKPINSRTGKIISSNGRKSILEVPPSDTSAFYRCKAENKVGRDRFVFSLLRTDKRTDTLKIEQGEAMTADQHQNVTLMCTGKFQYSGPPYWMYDNNLITNTQRISITEKISPLENTTYLEIFNAQVNDSGTYRCVAPSKNKGISTDAVKLNVLAVTPPSIEFESQTVNANNTVTLNCTVSGHPRPTITWYKNGKLLEVRKDLQSTSECSHRRRNAYYHLDTKSSGAGNPHTYTLVICDARQYNSGEYQCSAMNTADETKKSAYLDVLAPPKIKLDGDVKHWKIGDRIAVKCSAKGNPKPHVRWLKQRDDGLFVPFGNVSSWSLGHKVLVVQELAEDDFTNYRCEAKNKLKKTMKPYSITETPVVGYSTSKNPGAISKPALIAIVVSGGMFILLLLFIIAVLYRRKKLYGGFYILTLPPMPDYIKKLDPSRPIQEQTNKLPLCPDWEFSRNRLTLGKVIGSGAFGQVYISEAVGIVAFDPRSSIKGKSARRRSRFGSTRSPYYNNKQVTTVACKGLKEDATESEYRDLVSELKILMHIGEHKNIVNLLGACTKGRECDLLVIIEFCPHGNLLEFLRKRRDLFEAKWAPATEKPDEMFTTTDLVITAFQVARAMEFLASRRCVHRDLAARNVLVGDNYVMKVADFGLARDIYKDEHYVKTTSGLLPVKWMAIEALVDRIYTHQSDVWSFGVLLWEIFTLGGSPYPGLPANEVYQYLMEGQRMHEPDDSPEDIYALMLSCWEHDPNQRPVFSAIVQTTDKLLQDKNTQTGEEYLELENEIDPRENQPYYLQPDIHSFQPPESPSPFDNLNSPLPPLPQDEMELRQLLRRNSEDPNSNTKDFVLKDVPKHKIKKHGSYEELDNQKKSDSSGIVSDDEDYESEKEHLMRDYDGDRVFDSPPPYINSKPYSNDFTSNYANEEPHKKSKEDGVTRGRQQSARYV